MSNSLKNNLFHRKYFHILLVVLISTVIFVRYQCSNRKYSLESALDYYEFTQQQQKDAIKNLLKQASIIPANNSFVNVFPENRTELQIIEDILHFVKSTQEKFVIRNGHQERWEISASEWMKHNQQNIYNNLKILGFSDPIKPKTNVVDAICILGATRKRMADRLEYTESLIKNGLKTNTIILLTGERYVTENIDGTAEELSNIAHRFNIQNWKKLTETHLFEDLYGMSELQKRKLAKYTIDTPARDLQRPTTQSTLTELITWLKNHKNIKNILFVSNQPYAKYQKAIITSVFKDYKINIEFDVIGSGVQNKENIQQMIEGLGSYIWAMSPIVISKLGLKIDNKKIKDLFDKLYLKQPLIYKIVPQFLNNSGKHGK